MEHKFQLVHETNAYYILVFDEYSKDSQPHLRIGFSYTGLEQATVLEKARVFGRTLAKELGLKLEENP